MNPKLSVFSNDLPVFSSLKLERASKYYIKMLKITIMFPVLI